MKTVGRVILAGLLFGGVAAGALVTSHWEFSSRSAKKTTPPAIPVVTGSVGQEDFPITREGIGAVQAFNTVTIRARVDGTLQKVLFQEGQDVKAGDVLEVIDPRPFRAMLDQAVATKAKDEAQLANARLDLDRYIKLAESNAVTKQQVDTQKALIDQLQASVAGDQAAIENAGVQLSYTTITSPINGRTGVRLIDAGNMIHASEGAALLVVTQIEPIFVTFTLPEDVLDEIIVAKARGPVRVEAYKRDDETLLSVGTLTVVDNQIDAATGTIKLKATFANADRRLWPGAFVNVRVVTEIRHDATVVPSQAVQRGPNGFYVYAVRPDRTVEMRPITAGGTAAGMTLVETGLTAGETIVLDGQYKLQPGATVQPVAPAEKTARAG